MARFIKKIYLKIISRVKIKLGVGAKMQAKDNIKNLKKILSVVPDADLLFKIFQLNFFRRVIRPQLLDYPKGKNILIFAPHQDDDIIGAGGVMLKSHAAGKEIHCVYVTDGGAQKKIRKEEAISVWERLNRTKPIFLDMPCKTPDAVDKYAEKAAEIIKKYNPDTIFTPFILEPPMDHRITCYLLYKAMRDNINLFKDIEVWQYQTSSITSPNILVDITNVAAKKRELNELWKSQNEIFDYAHFCCGKDIANANYFKGGGLSKSRPRRPSAELFLVASLKDYMELAEFYFNSGVDVFYG